MTSDIRWKQRFANLQKAAIDLQEALEISNPDKFQRAGLIQFAEMTFELSWNTMKDYLEYSGIDTFPSPRSIIKKAFEMQLVEEGTVWLELLESRNVTSHTYNEQLAKEVEEKIRTVYFPAVKKFIGTLQEKIDE